jgi:uncharacterized membrane protein (DUF106 family)
VAFSKFALNSHLRLLGFGLFAQWHFPSPVRGHLGNIFSPLILGLGFFPFAFLVLLFDVIVGYVFIYY